MALPKVIKKLFLFPLLIVVLIILASLVEPTKDLTDGPRQDMNCPGTVNFNQSDWGNLTDHEHTIYSTGCYALHWDVLAFVGLLSLLAIWGWLS